MFIYTSTLLQINITTQPVFALCFVQQINKNRVIQIYIGAYIKINKCLTNIEVIRPRLSACGVPMDVANTWQSSVASCGSSDGVEGVIQVNANDSVDTRWCCSSAQSQRYLQTASAVLRSSSSSSSRWGRCGRHNSPPASSVMEFIICRSDGSHVPVDTVHPSLLWSSSLSSPRWCHL